MDDSPRSQSVVWPSVARILFLEISFWVLRTIAVALLILSVSLIVISWLGDKSFYEILSTYPIIGWAAALSMIWGYWLDKLKGVKPVASTVFDPNIFQYFSFEGRSIFWQAVKHWRDSRQEVFSAAYILHALRVHRGLHITFMRLGLDLDLVERALLESPDPADKIIASALQFGISEHSRISWDDMLRGVLQESDILGRMLEEKKITRAQAIAVVEWTRRDLYRRVPRLRQGLLYDLLTPKRNLNKSWSARPTPTLDRYSQNLTDLARVGLLTSARVRQKEVGDAINYLARTEGNNVVLVGEPGVGKASIVGDIALKMIQGQVTALEDHKLIALDLGLIAGSSEGLQQLFARIANESAQAGNVILFVGNLDELGKAKTSEGFDLSSILLSVLEQGNLQIIATSDPINYKKYIDNNDKLSRLFSRINVEELDPDRAVLVLEDLAYKIESRNRLIITLEAIKAAVDLSTKYIHTHRLPDKAFSLLDAAAVAASSRHTRLLTAHDVEEAISKQTNIPVGDVDKSEKDKLHDLKNTIQAGFVGQEEALDAVVEALKRARMGVSERNRPIGNFLFLGPTGVGKTELSKRLAEAYFGDEDKMIRLDMSEYQTPESAHRLFGAPVTAGDIALSGGSFTEAVKAMPFAVVLLDEIEKAHPDILNVFLQVLDEGRMTDNLGNTIDFTHTIIIATSNAQARFIQEAVAQQRPYADLKEELTKKLIQESFKPEFINRFDGLIVFKPLTISEIKQIAQIKIKQLQKRLLTTKDLTLQVSDEAIDRLAELGYDPALGARPLERVIRERIESKIANTMLEDGSIKEIDITREDVG